MHPERLCQEFCLLIERIAHYEYVRKSHRGWNDIYAYSFGKCYKKQETGFWTQWYIEAQTNKADGSKHLEGHYMGGKETGVWIFWYGNGIKHSEGYYVGGKKTGVWIYYWRNGDTFSKGHYVGGEKTGLWMYWNDFGIKVKEGFFDNGIWRCAVNSKKMYCNS